MGCNLTMYPYKKYHKSKTKFKMPFFDLEAGKSTVQIMFTSWTPDIANIMNHFEMCVSMICYDGMRVPLILPDRF